MKLQMKFRDSASFHGFRFKSAIPRIPRVFRDRGKSLALSLARFTLARFTLARFTFFFLTSNCTEVFSTSVWHVSRFAPMLIEYASMVCSTRSIYICGCSFLRRGVFMCVSLFCVFFLCVSYIISCGVKLHIYVFICIICHYLRGARMHPI